jgi:hypothetical protein
MMVDSDDDQDVPRAIFSAADELDRRAAEIERLQADVGRLRVALRQAESSYSETLLQLGATSKERDQLKAVCEDLELKRECLYHVLVSLMYALRVNTDDPDKLDFESAIADHDAEVIRTFVEAVKDGDSKDVNDVADFAEEYIAEMVAKTEKGESQS